MPPAVRSPRREHVRDRRVFEPAAADVDQRADDDADHVLEEGGRLDVEGQHRPLPLDVQAAHDADRRAAVAVRRAEGAEVVLAHQHRGRAPDGVGVERLAHVPRAARPPRRAHGVIPHRVAVDLAARREARVEVGRRLGDVDDRDVGRQDRVEAAQQAVRRDGQLQIEAGDLRRRRARPRRCDRRSGRTPSRRSCRGWRLQPSPAPSAARSALPAREVGAVVLDTTAAGVGAARRRHHRLKTGT